MSLLETFPQPHPPSLIDKVLTQINSGKKIWCCMLLWVPHNTPSCIVLKKDCIYCVVNFSVSNCKTFFFFYIFLSHIIKRLQDPIFITWFVFQKIKFWKAKCFFLNISHLIIKDSDNKTILLWCRFCGFVLIGRWIPVNFKISSWLQFPHMAQKIWMSKEPIIIVYPTLTGNMYILFWQFSVCVTKILPSK